VHPFLTRPIFGIVETKKKTQTRTPPSPSFFRIFLFGSAFLQFRLHSFPVQHFIWLQKPSFFSPPLPPSPQGTGHTLTGWPPCFPGIFLLVFVFSFWQFFREFGFFFPHPLRRGGFLFASPLPQFFPWGRFTPPTSLPVFFFFVVVLWESFGLGPPHPCLFTEVLSLVPLFFPCI